MNDSAALLDELRPVSFALAYRMLGSVAEAEDVVQEALLRVHRALDSGERLESPRAYVATVTTRLAIDELRSARARRERYVGDWLPEPILTDASDDPAQQAEMADSLSMAMLVLLETLSPDERAVFVLREVFGFEYDEIAGAVGKSVASVRQVAHRAREHVHARRKRFEPVDSAKTAEITEQFLTAAATGDIDGLLSMLAPDAIWTADSGGKASAARRPVVGADKVAKAIIGIFRLGQKLPDVRIETAVYNSAPAVVVYSGDHLEGVFLVEIVDGKITHFYAMRNPDKLVGITIHREITR
jgi:RNA polymerase sigma-70 factor, ECF subfamily